MPTDVEILNIVTAAFETCPRPEHFADHTHCCECAEHDELLRSRDRDTLVWDDVGHPGWDPICFVTNEGFAYYLPSLARLALIDPTSERAWYLDQLLFHLNDQEKPQKRRPACTPAQREAVVLFLKHVLATRRSLVDDYGCEAELRETIALWGE